MSLARRSFLLLLWITGFVGASAQYTVPAPAQDLRVVGITLSGNKVTRDRIILRELLYWRATAWALRPSMNAWNGAART